MVDKKALMLRRGSPALSLICASAFSIVHLTKYCWKLLKSLLLGVSEFGKQKNSEYAAKRWDSPRHPSASVEHFVNSKISGLPWLRHTLLLAGCRSNISDPSMFVSLW
jgi:hypothetical protein